MSAVTSIVWLGAPPSLQPVKVYWYPAAPACGEGTLTVWNPAGTQNVAGAIRVVPSSVTRLPDGTLSIVTRRPVLAPGVE